MHKMKNSGIEWIGKIPKEWNIIKCKYVSNLYTGNSIKDEDLINKVKFLEVGNFKDYFVLNEKEIFSEIIITEDISKGYFLKNGDIVFVRSNGSKELVGRTVIVENIDFPLTYYISSGVRILEKNSKSIAKVQILAISIKFCYHKFLLLFH